MLSTAFSQNISSLVDIVNNVNTVYSVNSVYSFRVVFLFIFCLSFAFEMGFNAKCVCEKHDAWRHGPREGPVDRMRVVDPEETRFCSFDASKNKSRKRRICLPCRGRIAVEIKCSKLEVSRTVLHAYIFVVFDRCVK